MEAEILAVRAKSGDADAFAALVQRNMKSMYKIGRSVLRNDEDVADAVQETVLTDRKSVV